MPVHVAVFERGTSLAELDVFQAVCAEEGFVWERLSSDATFAVEVDKSAASVAIVIPPSERTETVPFLKHVQALCKGKALIAILPGGAGGELLESVDQIVDDFVLWPPHKGELARRILRLTNSTNSGVAEVSERLTKELGFAQFVGQHPSFLRVVDQLPVIARSGAPVVITGETGTGKELSARAIHHLSVRRNFPFIPVDCGVLPEHLVENELFGHAKGAFTDAHADQQGLVALANKGTLFLDEVDALPLGTQTKLLRFLQERTFRPLGSERFLSADINVIAATNRDLESCVAKKEFRADLYYRLNVCRVRLPALRERASDIGLLARHFLGNGIPEGNQKVLSLAALRKLEGHDWPGNVRELFNVIQQAVVHSRGGRILPENIVVGRPVGDCEGERAESFREGRARMVATFERSFVAELLRKNAGNVSRAAREAQKDRRTFGRLIKKYRIDRTHL